MKEKQVNWIASDIVRIQNGTPAGLPGARRTPSRRGRSPGWRGHGESLFVSG